MTFAATDPPWHVAEWQSADAASGRIGITLLHGDGYRGIRVLADPLPVGTGCKVDVALANAGAMARRILSDPDIDATEPVPVRIAGIEALQMDVAPARGASICERDNEPLLFWIDEPELGLINPSDITLWHRHSYRVYLLDVPEGSSRILAIVVFGFDRDFERVVEAAVPVLDSLEFHAP